MSLPKHVEQYGNDRITFEIHHQENGRRNYWLFSSVAAIELQERDIGPLGEILSAYNEEEIQGGDEDAHR